jgi:outer membrane protein OmpA-like peptidoglycan-associated protein
MVRRCTPCGSASARLVVSLGLAMVGIGLMTAGASRADEREVLLGTVHASELPLPPLPASRESDPRALLSAALERLALGDRPTGQRELEILVGRHPNTPEAERARRVLAELYRDGGGTVRPTAGPPATDDRGRGADGWEASVRPRSALAEKFRVEVGDRVFFSEGSADLGARAITLIAAEAEWLKRQPQLVAVVEGHADDPGSDEENRRVSSARAEAVFNKLLANGVRPEQLRLVARGRAQRIAPCAEAECAAQNRRVVTNIVPRGAEPPTIGMAAPPHGPVAPR